MEKTKGVVSKAGLTKAIAKLQPNYDTWPLVLGPWFLMLGPELRACT